MKKLITGFIILMLCLSAVSTVKADLTMCEKSTINEVCIRNINNPKVQELLNAVKVYQKATTEKEIEEKHIIVRSLLKEILEVE